MAKTKKESFYQALGGRIENGMRRRFQTEQVNIPATVRQMRQSKKLTGAELCKRAGDLDPRTLTALEKGRIKNPSIATLKSVSRGLGVTISDIFREAEIQTDHHFYAGSQKGFCQIDFHLAGIKVVSFTPFIKDFFCGKLIMGPRKKLDQTLLKHPLPLFVSVLVGRVEIEVEKRRLSLREGENLFFNGILKHSFYNPLERESVLWMVTAPSFL